MKSRVNARHIQRLVTATIARTAVEFEEDLREFLHREHSRSGLMASSLYTVADSDGAAVASDVPYAKHFEAQTGAVEGFAEQWGKWGKKGGAVAAAAGKQAAQRVLPN